MKFNSQKVARSSHSGQKLFSIPINRPSKNPLAKTSDCHVSSILNVLLHEILKANTRKNISKKQTYFITPTKIYQTPTPKFINIDTSNYQNTGKTKPKT